MFKIKNIETPWFYISIAMNLFLLLSLIIFTSFFWSLEVSSKMGDTIGGTLGAFANFAALIFIYKAYNDQRSSTRNDLSIALYSEATHLVRNSRNFFDNLKYPYWIQNGNKFEVMSGSQLLQHHYPSFVNKFEYENIDKAEVSYLSSLVECYDQFEIHLERIELLKRRMVEPYQLSLNAEILVLMKDIVNPIDNTFNVILEWGRTRNIINKPISDATQFNQILTCILRYQSISSKISSMGFKGPTLEITSIFDGESIGSTNFDTQPKPELLNEEINSTINWSTSYQPAG